MTLYFFIIINIFRYNIFLCWCIPCCQWKSRYIRGTRRTSMYS